MALTYEPIASTTLSSATNSITFSSIPSTYTDLRLIAFTKSTRAITGDDFYIVRLNGDSGTNYDYQRIVVTTAGGLAAGGGTNQPGINDFLRNPGNDATNLFSFSIVDFLSYGNSLNKQAIVNMNCNYATFTGASGPTYQRSVSVWRNTAAITTVAIGFSSNNFQVGTTATLYGIKAA